MDLPDTKFPHLPVKLHSTWKNKKNGVVGQLFVVGTGQEWWFTRSESDRPVKVTPTQLELRWVRQ